MPLTKSSTESFYQDLYHQLEKPMRLAPLRQFVTLEYNTLLFEE